jgi:hypothetical protein
LPSAANAIASSRSWRVPTIEPRTVIRLSTTSKMGVGKSPGGSPTRATVPFRRASLSVCENALVLLRHKLLRERPFILPEQHGQRESLATSSIISRRRRVAMEFGTWRSGRSGGASGSVTLG